MKALSIDTEYARFGAARLLSGARADLAARVGPLTYGELDAPELPGPDWVTLQPRMSGICGSDLTTVTGRSSRWFEQIVSFPFVPGHEVVADDPDGRRVVLEPVLGCATRGIEPPCTACADGRLGNCEHLTHGCLEPGLQSGFCCDTGGGWSDQMVAHPSQLHVVPDDLDDRAAVLVEPTACAVHAALSASVGRDDAVAVIGAGTLGLTTIAALSRWSPAGRLVIAAKHPHQRRLAAELGTVDGVAPTVCEPASLLRTVRRAVGTSFVGDGTSVHDRLSGGVDVTVDCVGSSDSIAAATAMTRPGGRVVLVGMPVPQHLDLTALWQRELSLQGVYAYGTETVGGSRVRTFDLAFELVAAQDLGRLVSASYPLERYADAIAHASEAGRRGATKVVFDLRDPDHPAAPVLRAGRPSTTRPPRSPRPGRAHRATPGIDAKDPER